MNDSKILTSRKRKEIFEKLKKHSIIGVGFSSILEIEKFNILQATFFSMRRAVDSLKQFPDLLLFDGNMVPPNMKIKSVSIIKGDKLIPVKEMKPDIIKWNHNIIFPLKLNKTNIKQFL